MHKDQPPQKAPDAGRLSWRQLSEWAAPVEELLAALGSLAPIILSGLTFSGGLALMLSGSLPPTNAARALLHDVLPLPFDEASRLSASLSGLALIVLSRGLWRRIAKAQFAATLFLAAGSIFALAHTADWREGLVLAVLAGALYAARREFYRRGDWPALRPTPGWIALICAIILSVAIITLIGHRNSAYRTALFWQLAWHEDAPRAIRIFLGLTIAVAVLAVDRLFNRPTPTIRTPSPIPEAVRRMVAASPHSARHLALLGDKKFLLSKAEDAFLMYGVQDRSWICLAGPVGNPAAFHDLIWTFAEQADRAGARAIFCSAPVEMVPMLLDLGHAIVKMGELAHVDLATFSLEGPARKDLRYARSRAQRDGLTFEILDKDRVPALTDDLRAISDAWLATKKGREKGFVLGYFDMAYLRQFDLAVMRHEGRIVAFANIWRGAGRAEMAVDLMRHLPGQSPVLMDAFFVELMLRAQAEGYGRFLLGGAPMSGLPEHRLAPLWARIGTLIYRHGDEVYSFEGLRSFKEKFGPDWSPLYLTCPSNRSIPRALFDVALLIARGPQEPLDEPAE